jgi:GTP-binding protein EngB required for normal cell division
LVNDTKEVLGTLHTFLNERRWVGLPIKDHVEDTRPSGFSNDQLHVLKTYPILGPDSEYVNITDEVRNTILVRNLTCAQEHINMMEDRAKDGYYHILVTGDINSGKSTFINGLLRQDILPSGERSLTSAFVEILDARDLDGKEEAHLCKKGVEYDYRNEDTFKREKVEDLYDIMYDWHDKHYDTMYNIIKVYVDHRRVHTNFLGNNERKVRIIDSVGLNTDTYETLSLFKKQQEIDVLIFIIDARYGLTESSKNMMKSYCEDRTQLFVVITHLDCVCICKRGKCQRSCKEDCKQRMINAIKEISPETVKLADKLIHCVNPTKVPMWDDASSSVVGEMPSEWSTMETCLHTFIYDQFDFHKLSPIVNYLQKVMHDIKLLASLNAVALAPMIDETTKRIRQLQDEIGQLEGRHDKAYIEAKNKINETISDIRGHILWRVNVLREHPEHLVSRDMIARIDMGNADHKLRRLLQEKWREIEGEFNHKVNEFIQNCINHINYLVEGLPRSSTHENFIPIKSMLQNIHFDVSGFRKPEKSWKSIIEKTAKNVFSGLEQVSMNTWSRMMYKTPMNMLSKNTKKNHKMIEGNGEGSSTSSSENQTNG